VPAEAGDHLRQFIAMLVAAGSWPDTRSSEGQHALMNSPKSVDIEITSRCKPPVHLLQSL